MTPQENQQLRKEFSDYAARLLIFHQEMKNAGHSEEMAKELTHSFNDHLLEMDRMAADRQAKEESKWAENHNETARH